jgi:hypothetical protein
MLGSMLALTTILVLLQDSAQDPQGPSPHALSYSLPDYGAGLLCRCCLQTQHPIVSLVHNQLHTPSVPGQTEAQQTG